MRRCTARLKRLIHALRRAWPKVRVVVGGDSGFCRPRALRGLDRWGVDDVLGLQARCNPALVIAGIGGVTCTIHQVTIVSVVRTRAALILLLMPLQLLSGAASPAESRPASVQHLMQIAPTTHFASGAQAILDGGDSFDVVWPQLAANLAIGAAFFAIVRAAFHQTIRQMA